jgi:hypothetical protein
MSALVNGTLGDAARSEHRCWARLGTGDAPRGRATGLPGAVVPGRRVTTETLRTADLFRAV